ncbi:MAG: aminodeoxychorismate synthase component I, partial [Balneolales bacterium]
KKLKALIKDLRQQGPLIFLDSQSQEHPSSQKSYLAAVPDASIEAFENQIVIHHSGGERETYTSNPWEALKQFRKLYPGRHYGWFGYDLKNNIEKLSSENPDNVGLPDMFFMRPTKVYEVEPGLNQIDKYNEQKVEKDTSGQDPLELSNLRSGVTETEYLAIINKAKQLIEEGEFYEINITHQLQADFQGDPLSLYETMRNRGPVPFGAYIHYDKASICCASPERFLRKQGRVVTSEPIKGTSRRGVNRKEDMALQEDLRNSAKNKAENIMIVDLVRNDLSRIARQGSVHVDKIYQLQTFNTLHQMVSTITAEMDDKTDAVDAVRACFPMGSMTGAPKIRSMEYIEQLESYKRGIYSGAIGYFTEDDNFDFNVVIRTAIVKNARLSYSIGGAITADSDPHEEWEETWIKARALTGWQNEDVLSTRDIR